MTTAIVAMGTGSIVYSFISVFYILKDPEKTLSEVFAELFFLSSIIGLFTLALVK